MASRNGGSSTLPLTILWASDAIWHRTGYGVTTNHITKRMAEDGHKVYVYAPGALHQGIVESDGRTTLSSQYGDDRWGNQSLAYHLMRIKPDVVITWLDAQGLVAYGWNEEPVFMWAPIDTWPIPSQEVAIYGRASRIFVPSKWGQRVLADQGLVSDYLPCGIDLNTYNVSPEGRTRWRKQIRPEIDEEKFLIGSVGLNMGSPDRKGYGFEFDVIKKFAGKHKDFQVYIHTNMEGDGGAINLQVLRREMGLEDIVCFSRPVGPVNESELFMRDMYNAFDVLLHCGIAEGFGLPIIEAQACGTPVVANACTAMTELLGYGCHGAEPLGDYIASTASRCALPSVDNLLDKLSLAYADWKEGTCRAKVRQNVLRFEQDAVYEKYWRPILASVPPKINFESGNRKLMLAAGREKKEGFTHHDRELLWPHIDVAHDLNVFPYPWEDDFWDYIEVSDIMEHLRAEMPMVMDELWRITAPGGYVYIHTAEAGSWQLSMDPTHTQGFFLQSFDYFDPDTRHGQQYSYSDKKWKIIRRTEDPAGLCFVLTPRKLMKSNPQERETAMVQ